MLPSNFSTVLSNLTREVLRNQPEDLNLFCSKYFLNLAHQEEQKTVVDNTSVNNEENLDESIEQKQPVVICGPSSVGKGTLINQLVQRYPDTFALSISHTTREPRPQEEDGKDYYFISKKQMEKEIEENKFIESAHVHGNLYGTSLKAVNEVIASGKICIIEIDVQGARMLKKKGLINPVYIFIKPPSEEELVERIKKRNTETDESIDLRMENAKEELEFAEQSGFFNYLIVNDDIENAFQQLVDILV
eukprot:gb/GECH01003559.1/.p1 GENE.gb/GECH01003559.1/~~gb/GECH01003559.1/.p1  ORF type:complete len:248 (+),score=53.99 gb/GECH01003559.1/:1-744(+)